MRQALEDSVRPFAQRAKVGAERMEVLEECHQGLPDRFARAAAAAGRVRISWRARAAAALGSSERVTELEEIRRKRAEVSSDRPQLAAELDSRQQSVGVAAAAELQEVGAEVEEGLAVGRHVAAGPCGSRPPRREASRRTFRGSATW